jgi:pimeloyl-ACP methyl ester carboxylesterase
MIGSVSTFFASDGTELAYHVIGAGSPVVCVPGGPMQASAYLGDLGGLPVQLIMLDLRGTGSSGMPGDPATYRCDRQVGDVEALRQHLGLDAMSLLGHSAGGSLATLYAAEYPERVAALALITPSPRSVGIDVTSLERQEILAKRGGEPWFAAVSSAFASVAAGTATEADWEAMAPMSYGQWDEATVAHHAAEAIQRNNVAAGIFNSDGAFEPLRTRAALAAVVAPVLVLAGELDWGTTPAAAAEFAALFPNADLVVQVGASHFPWLDDPVSFVASVSKFFG